MKSYSKPRAAIGVFATPEALCNCMEALSPAVPGGASLYVLVASRPVEEKCAAMAADMLSEDVRRRIEYVEWQRPRLPDEVRAARFPDGTLGADHVSDYAGWLNRGAAGLLEKHLPAGAVALFVRATNGAQQASLFQEMRKHVSEKVILQDLPV